MRKFNASTFYMAVSIMARAHARMEKSQDKSSEISTNDRKNAPRTMRELERACRDLGIKVTELTVKDLISSIKRKSKPLKYSGFIDSLKVVDKTMKRELSLVTLFVLPAKACAYFEPESPFFGNEFESKFPSAVYELDEAAKCIALMRDTACVFHLMRIMEIGIQAVRASLGIPSPIKDSERNWGKILEKIKEEMGRRSAAKPLEWNANDKEFFAEAYASLDAVRVAWRNTTMHVENKYTEDEAEHIFGAVRGFMKKLASRMDEQGQPLA